MIQRSTNSHRTAFHRLLIVKKLTGLALLFIGGGGFLFAAVLILGHGIGIAPTVKLPLGYPTSIAVDKDENIYCALRNFGRIQKYDSQGRFIKGWFVDSGGAGIAIAVDQKNRVEVATGRTRYYYVFTTEGQLVSRATDLTQTDRLLRAPTSVALGPNGSTYSIHNAAFMPTIQRQDSRGGPTTVISNSIIGWTACSPFVSGGMGMLGSVLFFGFRQLWDRPKKKKESGRLGTL